MDFRVKDYQVPEVRTEYADFVFNFDDEEHDASEMKTARNWRRVRFGLFLAWAWVVIPFSVRLKMVLFNIST